jgi:hypothetical protein
VARLEKPIADIAREFVLVRLSDMRGVNLDVFDFDYDTTWAGFFLNADEKVYGRFGGRDAESAETYAALTGLKHAMQAALVAHRQGQTKGRAEVRAPRTVEQYPAARRIRENACIHCHQVHEFRRQALQAEGKWRVDTEWIYPPLENVGLSVGPEAGVQVKRVSADSAAARLGLRAGDVLQTVNGLPVASFADVQYALHRAPATGQVHVRWQRADKMLMGELQLADGWRRSDISWRWSLRKLDPAPGVEGEDLSPAEKKVLGLPENRLAFEQGAFVSTAARQAGIRQKDVIIGIDDRPLEMSARQFIAHVRLNYKVGDRVSFNILRQGHAIRVPMTLPGRGG